MARTVAELPPGARITDYISLGVITKTFPLSTIGPVLSKTGTASVRQRDLPAQVVVYYVIALALYMQSSYREVLRCLLEAVQWLRDPSVGVRVAGRSGISQARTRLSLQPLLQWQLGQHEHSALTNRPDSIEQGSKSSYAKLKNKSLLPPGAFKDGRAADL